MWAVLRCDGLQVCDGIIFPSRLPGFRACWTCWLACAYLRHQLCCPSWRATSWGSGHYCPCFLHFDKSLEPRWQARLGSWRGSKSLQNQFLSIKYQWEKLFVVNRSVVLNLNIRWSQWVQLSPTFVFGRRAPLCLSLSLYIYICIIGGSLEVKLLTLWADERQRRKSEEKVREEKRREEKSKQKCRKIAKYWFFQCFLAPAGRNLGLPKRHVRSWPREKMKNCTPLWHEADFQVESVKNPRYQTTFGSWDVEQRTRVQPGAHFQVKMCKAPQCWNASGTWDVEKMQAVVPWSTFPSQIAENTSSLGHFCKLRCWKNAHHCGAKHVSMFKVVKRDGYKACLGVQMWQKFMAWWREVHIRVQTVTKNWFWAFFST